MKIHIVRQGDTVSSVASRLGCCIDTLIEANMLPVNGRLTPGMALCAPSKEARHIELFGFQSPEHIPSFTYFSPRCAVLSASGSLSFPADVDTAAALSSFAMPILSIKPENSHEFLRDDAAQEAFLSQLFPVLALRGFRGVLLENSPVYSFDADALRSFLTTLSAALHTRAYFLFTELRAKSAVGLFDGAECTAMHTELADRIILDTGKAPLSEKKTFIEKICAETDSRRLLLGFNAQAEKLFDAGAEMLSTRAAMQLALTAAEKVDYDPHLGKSSFCFGNFAGNLQQIYFTDPRGLNAIISLAECFSLAGIAARGIPVGIDALDTEKFIV